MKTVLVTGANRGIGREVAREIAARGHHVFVGARDAALGREATTAIVASGGRATFVEIDLLNEATISAAVREIQNATDHLDVLVNNAATMARGDLVGILRTEERVLRETFETNVIGTLRVARAFVPLLAKSSEPRIVNVSSGCGRLSGKRIGLSPGYCISKSAQNGLTVQLANVLPRFAVNAISPGWVKTRMGGPYAQLSVAEGAETIVWAALEAPHSLTGKFLEKRAESPW